MLRLVARYADQWNTAWLGKAEGLAERIALIHVACKGEGRDPATIGVTVGVQMVFPDLGETDSWAKEPLTGSTEELAHAFHEYEKAGANHLIISLSPFGVPAVERLAEAVRLYRNGGK